MSSRLIALFTIIALAFAGAAVARASVNPAAMVGQAMAGHAVKGQAVKGHAVMGQAMPGCHGGASGNTMDCCADGMAACAMCCALLPGVEPPIAAAALTPQVFARSIAVAQLGRAARPALPPPRPGLHTN